MKRSQQATNLLRILLTVVPLALIILIILLILQKVLPGFIDILEHGDRLEIIEYLRSLGSVRGVVLGFLLQFIQILSIIFPGAPIQIAMGVVFGTWLGLTICISGYVAANVLVFWLSRKLGNRMDKILPVNQHKVETIVTKSEYPEFMVFLACLVPLLPNGIVPYIAARTKLDLKHYFISVFFGSIPFMLLLCAVGNNILEGDYLWAVILGSIIILSIILLYVFRAKVVSLALGIRSRLFGIKNNDK
ncbi:MAG: VTT domain-containing protein [Firmicutes bacterium]|nr:VTT domain-containing protein [Bacillota bacterium]